MILAILERNDVAICRFPKDLQDFARKDPIVSVQYSRPRFDNNSRHRRNSTLKVQCPTLNAEIHWTLGIRHWTFGVENANRHTILNRSPGNQETSHGQGARSL